MPHEFRTIEAFVDLIEHRQRACEQSQADVRKGSPDYFMYGARADTWKAVADIVRTSNLGIVYPPAGAPVRDTSSLCNGARHEASKFLQENSECRDAIELFLARRAFRAGWDARDQMKTESGK